MKVVIFGGSSVNEENYSIAYELGKYLAEKGHVIVNGAHDGTMEASAKGAREKGGKVIGITCKQIENIKPMNDHISESIITDDLFDRLKAYYPGTDLFIALPGGTGTLTEMMLTGDLMGLNMLDKKPILAFDFWKPVLEHVQENQSRLKGLSFFTFVKNLDDIKEFLEKQ